MASKSTIGKFSDSEGNTKMAVKFYEELVKVYGLLEKHYKDLQDFEFTIEKGTLFLLQTRNGKRTAKSFNRQKL